MPSARGHGCPQSETVNTQPHAGQAFYRGHVGEIHHVCGGAGPLGFHYHVDRKNDVGIGLPTPSIPPRQRSFKSNAEATLEQGRGSASGDQWPSRSSSFVLRVPILQHDAR